MADQQNHIPGKITYLVSVDESDDCRVAMRMAALRARNTGGQVVLLYVIEPASFQHWGAVSEVMVEERRQEAEERLQTLAAEVHDYADIRPVLFVEEGSKLEQILKLIDNEPDIHAMVLGCAPEGKGSNDLVQELSNELTKRLRIPLLIVPGNLTDEQIKNLT
ncbi:MAG TPA: universal stress protein [Alphaproteobacteria bacterium]|nr:MAG: hypothetical protein CFH36_00809 [Alphaproteobacteria bacterium MarineAlpha9_Bin6]PPR39500.1 MAG: hypothetical protein CFH35_00489 [Alphaproteobacteria bacterium MarineAlpha9_Bin5]HIC73342.1 universal stress protein [Alphaproteobacteria bacterium]